MPNQSHPVRNLSETYTFVVVDDVVEVLEMNVSVVKRLLIPQLTSGLKGSVVQIDLGIKALNELKRVAHGILITDLDLKGNISGVDLIAAAKHLPVIVISASLLEPVWHEKMVKAIDQRGIDAPPVKMIQKPYHISELVETFKSLTV